MLEINSDSYNVLFFSFIVGFILPSLSYCIFICDYGRLQFPFNVFDFSVRLMLGLMKWLEKCFFPSFLFAWKESI